MVQEVKEKIKQNKKDENISFRLKQFIQCFLLNCNATNNVIQNIKQVSLT